MHRHLGPGMLENTYELCLEAELRRRGLRVERQVTIPLRYLDVELKAAYRMDMLVEETVVVEIKAVQQLAPEHVAQVLSYLRFAHLRTGLLFNFNVKMLTSGGLKRVLRH